MSNQQNDEYNEAMKETLQPEDIAKINEANFNNANRIDQLIDRNFENAYNMGFAEGYKSGKKLSRKEEMEIYTAGMVNGVNEFKKKLDQAITDSVVGGGMVNGDCHLSLDLLNKYLQ